MTSPTSIPIPVPIMHPELKVYWDATLEGKLLLPTCNDCSQVIWYPRPYCPNCASLNITWVQASGKGTVYSYTINRRGQANSAEYRGADEYVLAYVQLEEGPRVLTNIVDCDVDSVEIGQAVTAVFHDSGKGGALLRFKPA